LSMYFVQLRIAPQNPKTPMVKVENKNDQKCCDEY